MSPEARLSLEAGGLCVGAQGPDMLEAGACVCRSPEARLSLEAGACALVPRGQTCWRLGLAGAVAIPLVTTWTEPFYVLVSDGLVDRKGRPAHTACVV